MGSPETEAFLARLLCHSQRMIVVNVAFRLYPDVEFPVPITDCLDVLNSLCTSTHLHQLCPRANPEIGFLLCGVSGGGTYASLLPHLIRHEALQLRYKITGCFLTCPVLPDIEVNADGQMSYKQSGRAQRSHHENANAPLMDSKMRDAISNLAKFDYTSPYMTPFNHHLGQESSKYMPKTYTQVCTLDPWRDSGLVYAEELAKAGVETKVDVYRGMPHVWWTTFPEISATERWARDTVEGVEWLLGRESNLNGRGEGVQGAGGGGGSVKL